jgi:hypothetical protein
MVVAGRVVVDVDDGASVVLGVRDTYLQRVTPHRWSNIGEDPSVRATLTVALIDIDRRQHPGGHGNDRLVRASTCPRTNSRACEPLSVTVRILMIGGTIKPRPNQLVTI